MKSSCAVMGDLLLAGATPSAHGPAVGKWYVSRCSAGRGGVSFALLHGKDAQP